MQDGQSGDIRETGGCQVILLPHPHHVRIKIVRMENGILIRAIAQIRYPGKASRGWPKVRSLMMVSTADIE
jgi:hypothetical protein